MYVTCLYVNKERRRVCTQSLQRRSEEDKSEKETPLNETVRVPPTLPPPEVEALEKTVGISEKA